MANPTPERDTRDGWPLQLGDTHPIYGTVAMMGRTGGERYYWFVKRKDVAMIPASTIVAMQETP